MKKATLLGMLTFQISFQGKLERGTIDLIIKGPNFKLTIPIKTPMGTTTPNASQNLRLNEILEGEGSF